MTDYDNNQKGVLFKNDKKQKETDPMYKGSIQVNGQDFWLSAWVNKIKNGEKAGQSYMSLSVTPKDQQNYQSNNGQANQYQQPQTQQQQVPPQVAQTFPGATVDDLPF